MNRARVIGLLKEGPRTFGQLSRSLGYAGRSSNQPCVILNILIARGNIQRAADMYVLVQEDLI